MRARLLPLLAAALLGGCLVSIGDARDDEGSGGAGGSAGSGQAASSGSGGTTSDAAADGATGGGTNGGSAGSGGGTGGSGGATGGSGGATGGSAGAGGSSGGSGGSTGGAGGATGGSGGSGECVVPLSDDFGDGQFGSQWMVYQPRPGFSPLESQGRLRFEFPDDAPTGLYAGIASAQTVDLTNCSVFVQATSVPSAATDAYLHLVVKDGDTYAEMLKHGTLLAAKIWSGSVTTYAKNDKYDPVAHAWWKLREKGGIIHFEVSSDGKSYSSYGTLAAPFDPKSVKVWLAAGTWQPESNPGSASFDNLNVAP